MKGEADRLAADKKKKKPIRYPTEDLDVRLAEKEKKTGIKVMKPVPSRILLPFGEDRSTFESFLMAWNFLVVYGYANILNLSAPSNSRMAVVNHCISPHLLWMSLNMHFGTR